MDYPVQFLGALVLMDNGLDLLRLEGVRATSGAGGAGGGGGGGGERVGDRTGALASVAGKQGPPHSGSGSRREREERGRSGERRRSEGGEGE